MLPGLMRANRTERERGDEQSGNAAHETEQRGFGEELAHEPLPSCSERDADGDLLLARGRAREQQVRDVRTRDEQHERH